jgi:hypothetical protein
MRDYWSIKDWEQVAGKALMSGMWHFCLKSDPSAKTATIEGEQRDLPRTEVDQAFVKAPIKSLRDAEDASLSECETQGEAHHKRIVDGIRSWLSAPLTYETVQTLVDESGQWIALAEKLEGFDQAMDDVWLARNSAFTRSQGSITRAISDWHKEGVSAKTLSVVTAVKNYLSTRDNPGYFTAESALARARCRSAFPPVTSSRKDDKRYKDRVEFCVRQYKEAQEIMASDQATDLANARRSISDAFDATSDSERSDAAKRLADLVRDQGVTLTQGEL